MDTQLRKILDTLYEAEGLIELALRRTDSSVADIAELARSKCYQVADLAAALSLSEKPVEICDAAEVGEAEVSGDTHEEMTAENDDSAEQLFLSKIVPEIDREKTSDGDCVDALSSAAEDTDEQGTQSEDANEQCEIARKEELESPSTIDTVTPAETTLSEAETSDEETEKEDAPVSLPEERLEEESEEEYYEELEEESENEQALRRTVDRKPIAPFFSINDKYRFRRELFSNSNPEWLDSLALLETMHDIVEAEDYLFDDLQWDRDSPDVKVFIEVLERYYRS